MNLIEYISQPWPWYVAGPLIALTMFVMLWFGKSFGVSSNFRTICAIGGGGKIADFFNFNWRGQIWNLVFLLGAIIGGFIASYYLTSDPSIHLAEHTVTELEGLGFKDVGDHYLPNQLFGSGANVLVLLIGGLLVGFGSRYAGGCTSGHAISGLSNLQIPSLIAVIGFFIGGLTMVHFIMPVIFS